MDEEPPDPEFDAELRATNIGEGLAHALIRHVAEAAKKEPDLDADEVLRAALELLRQHVEAGPIDYLKWLWEGGNDESARQN